MSGGRNREQQNAWNQTAQTQNAQITQVDPLEQEYRDQQKAYLDWENSPGRNVEDAPGLGTFIQTGQAAINRANQARQGSGALNLADPSSSGYAQKLREEQQAQMGQQFGSDLENAVAQRHAEATGSVLPLSQMNFQRKAAQLGNTQAMFGMWNQRQSKNWWDYLTQGVQMGAQVAGMF